MKEIPTAELARVLECDGEQGQCAHCGTPAHAVVLEMLSGEPDLHGMFCPPCSLAVALDDSPSPAPPDPAPTEETTVIDTEHVA